MIIDVMIVINIILVIKVIGITTTSFIMIQVMTKVMKSKEKSHDLVKTSKELSEKLLKILL